MINIKNFIKNEKDFIIGVCFFTISEILAIYHTKLFIRYNIELKCRVIIFIAIFFEIEFYKKGYHLLFFKGKHRE